MLIVIQKTTREEILSQSIPTNIKQFELAVTFLSSYDGIFKVPSKNNRIYFTTSINDDDFNVDTIRPGANEMESLTRKIERNNTERG